MIVAIANSNFAEGINVGPQCVCVFVCVRARARVYACVCVLCMKRSSLCDGLITGSEE